MLDCQGERLERVEERYVPETEPYLSEWCRIHTWHLVAIRLMDLEPEGDRTALQIAFRLAVQKFEVYKASQMSILKPSEIKP